MDNCLPPSALPGEDLAELSPPGLVVGSGAPTGLSSLGVSGVPWHPQIGTPRFLQISSLYLNHGGQIMPPLIRVDMVGTNHDKVLTQ